MWFGPPRRLTAASSCPWIGHPVSGVLYATIRPFQTRFPYGSGALHLNLAAYSNSPARSTKSTRSLSLPLLVNIGFQVLFHSPPGVLFTFPSRYSSLSVTWSYLAFGDGPPFFRQNSSCSDVLRIPSASEQFRLQGFYLLRLRFPALFGYRSRCVCEGPYPAHIAICGLGSSDFARHYSRNRSYFLFLRVLRCFSSPGSPLTTMDSS